jgi:glycosyltransferase involved in cell wall biosynthesis
MARVRRRLGPRLKAEAVRLEVGSHLRNWSSNRLKRRLQGSHAYYLLSSFLKSRYEWKQVNRRFLSIAAPGPSRGRALLSLANTPFFLKPGQPISLAHTQDWEVFQMAKLFLDLSYDVDVVHYRNTSFVPYADYTVFVDVRHNLERIAKLINGDCLRVMHADAAHYLVHNEGEARRLLELRKRRGVALRPQRLMPPNSAIEHAHCMTILGNEFTIDSYRYAGKPIYRVPVSTSVLYPWPERKDFDAVRRSFMWFGSGGLVHKGLDLVLDAFAGMPEYHLTVCGPVGENSPETDFIAAYRRELYETPNIHAVGWVDVDSTKFVELANSCVGLVYPSCSEGGGASALACMHAGMIPLLTYEASVDIEPSYGVIFESASVEDIRRSIRSVAERPAEELRRMAHGAWEFARANHTKERFAREYERVMTEILAKHGKPA